MTHSPFSLQSRGLSRGGRGAAETRPGPCGAAGDGASWKLPQEARVPMRSLRPRVQNGNMGLGFFTFLFGLASKSFLPIDANCRRQMMIK